MEARGFRGDRTAAAAYICARFSCGAQKGDVDEEEEELDDEDDEDDEDEEEEDEDEVESEAAAGDAVVAGATFEKY